RGDEAQAEALEIVEGIVERVDFQLAAVAGARIDRADGEAAAEPSACRAVDARRKLGQRRIVKPRRRFGERRPGQAFKQRSAHRRFCSFGTRSDGSYKSCPAYEQLNDLLQSGKSATMLPSMAASSSGHWNHEGSRRWQRAIVPSGPSRTQAKMSPRKPSTRAIPSAPSLEGEAEGSTRTSPGRRRSRTCSISASDWPISFARTHTRAS